MSNGTYCVIPAYNEEKNIVPVVEKILPLVGKVIVVDDCSRDGMVSRLEDNFQNGEIVILKHLLNRGQGAALKTGTEFALLEGAEIIVHFDADGQFLAEDIETITRPIRKKEAEIVFGSRFLGKESNIPWSKKNIIMPFARLINKIFLGVRLTDPQSGFRAMSARAARKIDWRQDRMAHCSEILFEATNSGLPVKEVPITVIYHDFGQKFSGGFKIIKELMLGSLLK